MFPNAYKGIPWYEQVKTIPEGTVLFEVWARNFPIDQQKYPNSREEHIANIRLTSRMITSAFGDKRLFFKHEKMDLDFKAKPDWKSFVPRLNSVDAWGATLIPEFPSDPVEQQAWVRGQLNDYSCPFAWLLNRTVNPIYR